MNEKPGNAQPSVVPSSQRMLRNIIPNTSCFRDLE